MVFFCEDVIKHSIYYVIQKRVRYIRIHMHCMHLQYVTQPDILCSSIFRVLSDKYCDMFDICICAKNLNDFSSGCIYI
jgi:hypothetical protein